MARNGNLDCKIYVGNLGDQGSKGELERVFSYYGHLKNVWVARNPAGFAFVEFLDQRDAVDAVRALDGRTICGVRARVEMSSGATRKGGRSSGGGRFSNHNRRDYEYDRRRSYRSRSRSPRKRVSRSRSRSRGKERRSYRSRSRSAEYSRRRSPSPAHSRPVSPVRDHSRSRSLEMKKESRSRSRSSD